MVTRPLTLLLMLCLGGITSGLAAGRHREDSSNDVNSDATVAIERVTLPT